MQKEESYLKKNNPVMWLAMRHHKTHKNEMLDFVTYPYLRQIYLDESSKIVMKSTQSGLTEWLIVLVFAMAMQGKQIFYTLPTIDLVGRFVKNRFYKSIEHSMFYKSIMDDNIAKASEAISLQHVRNGAIAFTGSNSTVGFTEYPADMLIVDEEDECDLSNLEMAVERLSNSDDRREFWVSNPSMLNYGIHAKWLESNQSLWHISADCGHLIQPDPFKHLLRKVDEKEYVIRDESFDWNSGKDIQLICDQCGKPINRKGDGKWIATFPGRKVGHQINKLFSTKVSLREIVKRFDKGLTNDFVMQRVYNADFGLPYTAEGANISEAALDRCVQSFFLDEFYTESACVIGVDVGTMMHVKISSLIENGELRARYIGSIQTEKELDELFVRYNIIAGVIDAQPEKRMAERLCRKHAGLFRCYYTNTKTDNVNIEDKIVSVNRTAALDNVKESILLKKTLLPKNAKTIPEYYAHMTASTRILKKDEKDYEWIETGPDHLFHASAYELIARNMFLRMADK